MTVGNVSAYGYGGYDDFMYNNSVMPKVNYYAQPEQNYTSGLSFQGQPQADTFMSNGTLLTLAGTAGAGISGYLMANPFEKENVFKTDLLNKANEEFVKAEKLRIYQDKVMNYFEKAYKTEYKKDLSAEAKEAIKKYLKEEKLTKAEEDLIADAGFKGKKKFSAKKLDKFFDNKVNTLLDADKDKIIKEIQEAVAKKDYTVLKETLANNKSAKALVEGLEDGAKTADIEKLIKENPALFGIKETEEAKIAKEAQKLAKGHTKKSMVSALETEITANKALVDSTKNTLNSKILAHWDADAKAFKSGAPEGFASGLKTIKWKTAGKWALIAAGAGLLLNWAFGGNKK